MHAAVAAKLPPKIKHFALIGVHLGYRYEDLPLIVPLSIFTFDDPDIEK